MKRLIKKLFRDLLSEDTFYKDTQTVWMWISPDNKIYEVPKLRHQNFIMQRYKDIKDSWDYDTVFNQAIRDGWVRAIYEYNSSRFLGELSVNTYEKSRIIDVLKYVFGDLLKYGNKSVYVDYEYPSDIFKSKRFSTFDTDGKRELNQFINS